MSVGKSIEPLQKKQKLAPLSRDWSVSLGAAGVAADMYPTKWNFSTTGTPSCTGDYVVFGANAAGVSGSQANIVAFNHLYVNSGGTGLCSGTAPSVLFAYFVGTGTVQTSPTLSGDGTKVAYVESISGGSKFHVTTIGTTGSNGTVASPKAPGSGNNAADSSITMSGSVSVTFSSPFVDYQDDIAYVGDDSGNLHKFTPVFAQIKAAAPRLRLFRRGGQPW